MAQMDEVSRLKGGGYLTSTVSVILLGVPALESALHDPMMLACLVGGMGLSIGGMALRWRSHRKQQRQTRRTREEMKRQLKAV
jgi:hypothetical protein